MAKLVIAVDLDGTVLSFPEFFQNLFQSFQGAGNKVGVLTARPEEDKDALLKILEKMDIHPDFFLGMPDQLRDTELSQGEYKAQMCNALEVDILFDDFQSSDPKMIADFFSKNTRTIPFTSWAYQADLQAK